MSDTGGKMDINEVFRGGGRAVAFLDQINKASIVMLDETGLVAHALAVKIARGIAQVIDDERKTPPTRSADYLDYEPRLLAAAGPDASRLHTGRSRQDIASAIARMNLRDGLLREIEALLAGREKLLALAAAHTDTIIPAYTHGVQAQPTTLAHYLLAFAGALSRQSERLQQAYARINQNPLGTAALATSSFKLDRARTGALLGFDGIADNAYDANHLAPIDCFLDVANALAIVAVQLGMFAQDLHAQYAEPVPWFMLASGGLTGVSSIMPQKRNPAALEQLRAQSSILLGEMQGIYLLAHNNRTGMFDYRLYDPVPAARALAEVNADYSTTTEIADALLQRADVPFRIGHHFASKLTDFGRGQGLTLHEIPYAEAARIYAAENKQPLPLDEAAFREIISAEYMVYGRQGRGGPQPQEVARMLADERAKVAADRAWFTQAGARVVAAEAALDQVFYQLAGVAAPGG